MAFCSMTTAKIHPVSAIWAGGYDGSAEKDKVRFTGSFKLLTRRALVNHDMQE